jgi:hypothetical protein
MSQSKNITIQVPEPLLDLLSDIAKEYSANEEVLIAAAIKKLIEDIKFIRDLRAGKFNNQ